MNKSKWILGILATVVVAFTIVSCDNSATNNLQATPNSNVAYYASILTMSDFYEVDETANETETKSTLIDKDCFSVNVEHNDNGLFWPRKWTLTYAAEGCTDPRGNIRKGAIQVELTDFWKKDNAQRTVEYKNFYYNNAKIEGKLTILNTGLNDSGNFTFTRKFDNGLLLRGDTAQMTWDCNKNVEMTAGSATYRMNDDIYSVTGGSTGVNFDGKNFTMEIVNALQYHTGCFYPVSGTLTIQTEGQSIVEIDYGDGECDNVATMTQDGISTEIEL